MKGLPLDVDMARAWHAGRKTVTRRLMKPQPDHFHKFVSGPLLPQSGQKEITPPYQPGEVVFIQEPYIDTWSSLHDYGLPIAGWWDVSYRCDYDAELDKDPEIWKSPVTMPERFSRSKARIADVRVEQVQAITEEEALREGVVTWMKSEQWKGLSYSDPHPGARGAFAKLWKSLYPGSWRKNEWVWVFGLEKVAAGRYCADCETYIGPDEWHCPKCGGCL